MVVLSNDGLNIDGALERKLRLRRTRLIVTGSWHLLQTFERSGTPASPPAAPMTSPAGQARWDLGGGRTTDYLPRRETSRAIVPSLENIGISPGDGVAMSRREFIDVLGGASIAWSLAFPDARGQELRRAYRVGFLTLSQLK
jgi:hypothetical protein